MRIMREEIFGPVVAISKFKDVDDVVKQANDTEYGLVAGVFTSNVKTAIKVSNQLECGSVCEYKHAMMIQQMLVDINRLQNYYYKGSTIIFLLT